MSETSPTAPIGSPPEFEPRDHTSEHLVGIRSGSLWDGRYLIERSLGDGGMGCVLLARDLGRPRAGPVAVKVLQPRFREVATPYFMREYSVQRALRHPHVAAALDLGFDHQDGEEVPYFAMQHVPGVPLSDILQDDLPPLVEVWRWMLEALEAIDAIHRAGYLHRDIKPGNLLVDRSATGSDRPIVRLIDFGIAVPLAGESETFFIGTPEFSAPERIECDKLDVRSDLYSIGLVLYELIDGRPPWEGTDPHELAHVRRTTPAPPIENPACPKGVAQLVADMLEADLRARPATAGEVIVRLREATDSPGPIESPEAFAARVAMTLPTSASYSEALRAAASPGGKALVINVPLGHDGQGLLEAVGDRQSLAGVRVVRLRLDGRRGPPLHEMEAALDVFRRLRKRDSKSPLALRGMAGAATMLTRLHRPTMLSIEGLERADAATLMVLASAFLGAHNANLSVVATMTTGARPKAPAALAEFLTHTFVRHVGLQPLTPAELGRHIELLLGPGVVDDQRIQSLHAESRGLPTELMRLLAAGYRRGILVRRADDYVWTGDAAQTHLEPRIQVSGELADRLSLMRVPLPYDTVLRYLEDRSGVDRLVADGVLVKTGEDWLTCVMREVLGQRYGLLSTHRRRALHRRLADALLTTPPFAGHAALVANQLVETARPASAATWLVRAAVEGLEQGAGGQFELLDWAINLLEADHTDDQALWDWKAETFEATLVLARKACDHERHDAAIELLLHLGAAAGHLPTLEKALTARIDRSYTQGDLDGLKSAVSQLLVFQESCGGEPAAALQSWIRAIDAAVAGDVAGAFAASAEGLGLPGAERSDVRVRLLALRAEVAVAWSL
ncbi:MAG: serine/threonine-protein kinase, partial [Myxococcota bacterium]